MQGLKLAREFYQVCQPILRAELAGIMDTFQAMLKIMFQGKGLVERIFINQAKSFIDISFQSYPHGNHQLWKIPGVRPPAGVSDRLARKRSQT